MRTASPYIPELGKECYPQYAAMVETGRDFRPTGA